MDDFYSKPIRPGNLEKAIDFWIASENTGLKESSVISKSHFNIEDLIARTLKNNALLEKLMVMAKTKLMQYHIELASGIPQNSEDGYLNLAHNIKGLALNMCFDRLALLANQFQHSYQPGIFLSQKLRKELKDEIQYLLNHVDFNNPLKNKSEPIVT